MPVKKVMIKKVNGSLKVIPPIVTLSKQNQDTIEWKSKPSNKIFLVCFGGNSPFKKEHFHNGSPKSGAITVPDTRLPIVHKYTVEFDGKVLDPGIIIRL